MSQRKRCDVEDVTFLREERLVDHYMIEMIILGHIKDIKDIRRVVAHVKRDGLGIALIELSSIGRR
jgi:hypothetical protein